MAFEGVRLGDCGVVLQGLNDLFVCLKGGMGLDLVVIIPVDMVHVDSTRNHVLSPRPRDLS